MPKKEEPNIENVIEQEPIKEAEISQEESVAQVDDLSSVVEDVADSEPQVQDVEFSNFSDSSVDMEIDSAESGDSVTIQPVKFASFEDASPAMGEVNKNLDILMDIKLQMTVELGRTELPVKKVLELTRGSIVELQKVAGEPVELYANGKLVAHGEVVVIEDNFGLRITSITDPEDRLKGL